VSVSEIKHFMTRSAHAIGHDQPLKLAHERMHQFGIRHLPVLDGGVLVGVLSERDIALIGAISPKQVEDTPVEDAMSTEPYAVEPETDVEAVTAHMAEHKHGCAVVMEHHKVIGVFTSTDALGLLTTLLRAAKDNATLSSALVQHAAVARQSFPAPAPKHAISKDKSKDK
jgi:acetoin utilization protein AcuB